MPENVFTRVGGQPLDGEVVCLKCGKKLNRTDLNCWSCGSRELEVRGADLKAMRTVAEEEVPRAPSFKVVQTNTDPPYCEHGQLRPCINCQRLTCHNLNRCVPCARKRFNAPHYTYSCPAGMPS